MDEDKPVYICLNGEVYRSCTSLNVPPTQSLGSRTPNNNRPLHPVSSSSALLGNSDVQCHQPIPNPVDHTNVYVRHGQMKLGLVCVVVINIILMAIVIVSMIMAEPRVPDADLRQRAETTTIMTESSLVKCTALQNKFPTLSRKKDITEMCSLEDLIDNLLQYLDNSVRKQTARQPLAFHLTSNDKMTGRCKDSRTLKCLKAWKLNTNTTSISFNGEDIFIPSSGTYYLYSRLEFEANVNKAVFGTLSHMIRYSNTGHSFRNLDKTDVKFEAHEKIAQVVSYVEKVHFLERGSQIKVAVDLTQNIDMEPSMTKGTLGLFKI